MITSTRPALLPLLLAAARAVAITVAGPPLRIRSQYLICGGVLAAMSIMALAQATTAPAAGTATNAKGPPAGAALCFSCHGPDGNPITPDYPILKGQQRDYLVAALGAYRAAQRTTSPNALTMAAIAKGLTDAEIAELADWFAMVRR